MGHHKIRFAVLPHANGWQAGGVVPAALAFNQPLVPVFCEGGPDEKLLGRRSLVDSTSLLQVIRSRVSVPRWSG